MILFPFSKKKRRDEAGIVFDIGSGHVGAALVVFSKDTHPTILWNTRIPMVFQQHIDFNRFLQGMLETLRSAAGELEQKGMPLMRQKYGHLPIGEVTCIFSSPWYISQTKIIVLEKKQPFEVTKDFIGDVLAKAEKQFQRSAALQKVRKKLGESIIVERHIIETALNGYQTEQPYGKMARSVRVSLFLSMIGAEVAEKTRDVLEKFFNARTLSFHSSAIVSFSVVRDLFHTEESFLLVDVGGEITDVSLVREGVLHETVSFPTGVNFLFRTISQALGTLPEEAHSLTRLYLDGKKDHNDTRLADTLTAAEDVWLKSLKHAFTEVGDGLSLPRAMFLVVDSDISRWFRDIIEKNDFSAYTHIDESFIIITIGERKLYEYITMAPDTRRDPFLSMEALFLNRIFHEDVVSSREV